MYSIKIVCKIVIILLNIIFINSGEEVDVDSSIELRCSLPLKNITSAKWIEEYSIYPISKIELGGTPTNKKYVISVDAWYSKDLTISTLKIKNVTTSNSGCYKYQVFSSSEKMECERCFVVKPHVVFKWNREGNNIIRIVCYVGDYNMHPYTLYWKVRGVSVGGRIAFDPDEHDYNFLNSYEATEIKLYKSYDPNINTVWCRYITYNESIVEYPIRFLGTTENKFHHVDNSNMRVVNDYW